MSKLVLFYASWCPHCHALFPEWNKLLMQNGLQGNLSKENSPSSNIKDDSPILYFESETDIAKKVRAAQPDLFPGFPTIAVCEVDPKTASVKILEIYEEGERTAAKIQAWAHSKGVDVPATSRSGVAHRPRVQRRKAKTKSKSKRNKKK